MIKGVGKQVYIVSCRNDVFEEAIFVVNPRCRADKKTIIEEAERIIDECTSAFTGRKKLFPEKGRKQKRGYPSDRFTEK